MKHIGDISLKDGVNKFIIRENIPLIIRTDKEED